VNRKTLKTLLSIFSLVLVVALIFLRGPRESEPGTLVEEGPYHKLYADGELYTLRVKDCEGNTVREDGPMTKRPVVTEAAPGLWSVSSSAGPDITLRWTYFYSPSRGLISESFYGVLDAREDLVILAGNQALTVRGIFSEEPWWDLTDFSQPLAEAAATPFRSAAFAEEGKALELTYLSGEDFHEVTETVPLPEA
jgi:hypothetical protein